jgi:protein-arginine kinase
MINWYLQNGKDSDVVISSRIRLARNLADFPQKI